MAVYWVPRDFKFILRMSPSTYLVIKTENETFEIVNNQKVVFSIIITWIQGVIFVIVYNRRSYEPMNGESERVAI